MKTIVLDGKTVRGENGKVNTTTNGAATEQKQTPAEVLKTVTEEKRVEDIHHVSLTINQRLQKLQQLKAMEERYETLVSTREKLNRFKLSSTEIGDTLTLKDTTGNSFSTSNTQIIKDVYNLVKGSVDTMIVEVEKQIVF